MIGPGSREAPEVRAATPADIPRIAAILAANEESIEWPGLPGWPSLEHFLAEHELLVASLRDQVAGFAGTLQPAGPFGGTFLSDLFVDPVAQGRGVGRALLEVAFAAPGPRATFASADPRALPLYIRFGLLPRWPNLYLGGRTDALPETPPELRVELAEDPSQVAALFRSIRGQDREADARYWLGLPGGTGVIVRTGSWVAAVGVARDRRTGPGRWLDRLAIAAGADPLTVIPVVLRAVAPEDFVGASIQGPNPCVALLLRAGFRILDRDTFCSTEPPLLDPMHDVPDPGHF